MSKVKNIAIVLLIILTLFMFATVSFGAEPTVTQEMVNHATTNNKGNPNTVIVQNTKTNEYYALGIYSNFDVNTVTNGNWTYRTYKGVQGLTSPGWYVLSIQKSPSGVGVTYDTINGIGSNSFVQLSGDFSHLRVVYSYKDILKEDGTVFFQQGYLTDHQVELMNPVQVAEIPKIINRVATILTKVGLTMLSLFLLVYLVRYKMFLT